ncbi:MAG TPA: SNF2-related protein [Oculatellaceae cyanobacterium]
MAEMLPCVCVWCVCVVCVVCGGGGVCVLSSIPSSPLLSVTWWRVVLDEAQHIRSSVTTSARMAARIAGVHRWCIRHRTLTHSLTHSLSHSLTHSYM